MSRYRVILPAAAVLVLAGSFLPLPLLADLDPPPPPPKAEAEAAPVAEPEPAERLVETPPPPAKPAPADAVQDDPPPPPPKKEKRAKDEKAKKEQAEKERLEKKQAKKKQAEREVSGEERLHVPAKLVKMAKPEYPASAIEAKAEGTVHLVVVVDEKGKAVDVEVVKGVAGHKELDKAAVEAIYRSKFEPATENGRPVKSKTKVPVAFKLS